jgi:prophage antirepressor-like protein
MESVEKIETTLEGFTKTKYIRKDLQEAMKNNLKIIKKYANEEEEQEIEKMIKIIIKKNEIRAEDRIKIKELKPKIIKIIKKYEEKFEKKSEETIEEKLTVEEIEERLDKKIPGYNSYNENHPMRGVTYDKTNKRWQFKNKNKNINISKKDYNDIIETARKDILVKNFENFEKNYLKKFFIYEEQYFVCYWEDDEVYFDIQHIISVLDKKTTTWNEKYNEFSDKIIKNILHKNEYGGYILRELIDEITTYELVMSSNSEISKKFKKEVARKLVELRKEGKFIITNKKPLKGKTNIKKEHSKIINEPKKIENENKPRHPLYKYNNPKQIEFVRKLMDVGKRTALCEFAFKHILYAFIMVINTDHEYIIIKFGYTEDIYDRMTSLANEYKTEIHFIKAKIINGKKDEEDFHNKLKFRYPELIEEHKVNEKNKEELYKFSPILLKEYDDYLYNTNDKISQYIKNEMEMNEEIYYNERMEGYTKKEYMNGEQMLEKMNEGIKNMIELTEKIIKLNSELLLTKQYEPQNTIKKIEYNKKNKTEDEMTESISENTIKKKRNEKTIKIKNITIEEEESYESPKLEKTNGKEQQKNKKKKKEIIRL